MSPRAAWRLERLGFVDVYDYAAGKIDWMAAGLPTVRADTTQRRALDAAADPSTCRPETPIAVAAKHAAAADRDSVVVINDVGIVLGRLGPRELAGLPTIIAEHAMQPGPATVRAHEPLDALLTRMARRHVTEMIVTTPEGRLLGVVRGR